ncbi:MAG: hypothetical protein RTU30_01560 [Candidatus Thorarchaeota archaeon]
MSERGSSQSDRITLRELIGDFFCWLFFPIFGIVLFILSGILVLSYSILSLHHHLTLLFALATPTGVGLIMFLRTVMNERGGETHVPLIIMGQILMVVGAMYPFGIFIVASTTATWMLSVGSLMMLSSLITNFIGFLAWLNIWYMRSRQ